MEEEEAHLIPTDISSQILHLGLFFLVFFFHKILFVRKNKNTPEGK